MTTVTDTMATINDAALKLIAGVQARTLEANKTLAGFYKTQTASMPSWLKIPDGKFALDLIGAWTATPAPAKATRTKAAK
jgi:hypothetical protein